MRKFACAAVFTLVVVGIATAEELTVLITKSDADKGTLEYKKYTGKGKDKKVEDTVIKGELTKTAKIVTGKKDEDKKIVDGDAVKDGLKNTLFTDAGDKGVNASITIADEGDDKGKVTKIRVFQKKKV